MTYGGTHKQTNIQTDITTLYIYIKEFLQYYNVKIKKLKNIDLIVFILGIYIFFQLALICIIEMLFLIKRKNSRCCNLNW